MTKEQEAIERLEKRIKDNEDYKTTQVWLTDDVSAVYTVLNMTKENSAEIKKKNTELAEKNKKINELSKKLYLCTPEIPQCQHGKYVSYSDLIDKIIERDKEIEKKDKIIDLMAEQIKIPEPTMKIESFDIKPKTKFGMRYLNKEEVKQYFERKAKKDE